MVPDEFHDFFVASAGVAGALIGLLFVAISVHPEQIAADGEAGLRFRPSASLAALLNPLLLSLLLLIPGTSAGPGLVSLGLVGVAAVVALLVGVVRQLAHEPRLALARSVVLLLGQGAVYGLEISLGLRLIHGAEPGDPLRTLCVLVIVLFAIGIERAWEFVGAKTPGLLGAFLATRRPPGVDRS
ncbi:MAG TPA: hypothetical protein VGC37_18045 [Friedmanniella sp.]